MGLVIAQRQRIGDAAAGLGVPSDPVPMTPAADNYSLRFVATHTLYDNGASVLASPSLAALRPAGVAKVNPYDLDRLGVTTGDRVKLLSEKATLIVAVEADPGVIKGTVAMDVNIAVTTSGINANAVASILDSTLAVTDPELSDTLLEAGLNAALTLAGIRPEKKR